MYAGLGPLGAGIAARTEAPANLAVISGESTDQPSWPLLSGDNEFVVDDYFELLHILGRGSYGSVYKARVRATGAAVAVKVIPAGAPEEVAAIQREIEMLKQCNHPNVVRYLGSWAAAGSLWIAMEYCGGGSVADLVHAAEAPLDEAVIAYICYQALAGLAYLHSLGKVHRDIKCGNILLGEGGAVKLADFGVAAQLTATMSKRNTFIGTPHWMAPEVIQESRYDGKVDVWALGISAVEMAEVAPPRWAVHPMRVIFMISRDPPPQLADRDRWSLPFHDFVAQCLQKDTRLRPTARFLQQHKFMAGAHGGAPAALLPLVRRSRDLLAALADDADACTRPAQRMAPDATGCFSWRSPRGGAAGATLPSAAGGVGGAAAAWARLGANAAPADGGQTPRENASGTMLATPGGMGSTLGVWGSAADGTVVVTPGAASGADYGAALRAVAESNGHRAAPDEAAAEETLWPGLSPGAYSAAAAGEGCPPAASLEARVRLESRLRAAVDGGAFVPLPFLRAADAAPAALLADIRRPHAHAGLHGALPLGWGVREPLEPDAWIHALADLATGAPLTCGARTGAGAAAADAGPHLDPRATPSYPPAPRQQPAGVAQAVERLPPEVLTRVRGSPGLRNLACALAHHRRMSDEVAVAPVEIDAAAVAAADLADTLRILLCI
ncbi:hypothetical protein WJX81_003390 [Elliptochloris bilobata]|uniref:non-specific serine/threonine protein kinase n=1 Tax=Elliptochloris bilobata TaxID=381761 RepID=A0AAW1RN12_9CHLO